MMFHSVRDLSQAPPRRGPVPVELGRGRSESRPSALRDFYASRPTRAVIQLAFCVFANSMVRRLVLTRRCFLYARKLAVTHLHAYEEKLSV